MALWLEMARIVLGHPCACALRRLALPMEPVSSCLGPALRGSARALASALRKAARVVASNLSRCLSPLALPETFSFAPAAPRPDASSASRARFAHPARGGFPHAGGKTGFGIDGRACASARADGARSGLRPRRWACAPSLRA